MSLLSHAARTSASRSAINSSSSIISRINSISSRSLFINHPSFKSSLRTSFSAAPQCAPLQSHSQLHSQSTFACTFQQLHRSFHQSSILRAWNFRSSASTSVASSSPVDPVAWSPALGLYGCTLRDPSDFIRLEQAVRSKCDSLVSSISSTPVSLQHLAQTDTISNYLCSVIDVAELLKHTHPSQQWREAAARTSDSLGSYMHRLNHSPVLYHSISSLCSHPDFSKWSEETQRVATLLKRDMDAQGIGSSEHDRELINETLSIIHQAQSNFATAQNSEHSDRALINLTIDSEDLCHLQPEVRQQLSWRNTLQVQLAAVPHLLSQLPVEKWRKYLYLQYNSQQAVGQQGAALVELIQARSRLARILGKSSYAAHTVAHCIAGDVTHVKNLLNKLLESLQPEVNEKTKEEVMKLKFEKYLHQKELKLASSSSSSSSPLPRSLSSLTPAQLMELNAIQLHEWDRAYYTARVKERAPAVTNGGGAEFAEYFTLANIIQGWTIVCEKLFGLTLKRVKLQPGESAFATNHPSQHPQDEVIKLELWENTTKQLGVIYLDLFQRPNKFSNAASFAVRSSIGQMTAADGAIKQQMPVVTIVSALQRPVQYDQVHPQQKVWNANDSSAATSSSSSSSSQSITLFRLDSVEMLFHEFGHCLHNLLSATQYQHCAGARGELDFVELPSTLFEYFIQDQTFVKMWAKHYATNQPISSSLITAAFESKNLFGNLEMIHQCLIALFDQTIYGEELAQMIEQDEAVREDHPSAAVGSSELHTSLDFLFHSLHAKYSPFHPLDKSVSHLSESTISSSPYLRYFHLTNYAASYYCYLYCRIFARCIMSQAGSNGGDGRDFDTRYKELGKKLRYQFLAHGGAKNPRTILADLVDLNTSTTPLNQNESDKEEQQMKTLQKFVEQQVERFAKVL